MNEFVLLLKIKIISVALKIMKQDHQFLLTDVVQTLKFRPSLITPIMTM